MSIEDMETKEREEEAQKAVKDKIEAVAAKRRAFPWQKEARDGGAAK